MKDGHAVGPDTSVKRWSAAFEEYRNDLSGAANKFSAAEEKTRGKQAGKLAKAKGQPTYNFETGEWMTAAGHRVQPSGDVATWRSDFEEARTKKAETERKHFEQSQDNTRDVLAEQRRVMNEAIEREGRRNAGGKPSGNPIVSNLKRYFSPMNFAANMAKVAGWGVAVQGYQAIEAVVVGGAKRMIELEEATSRLDGTFKGVGGSAKQLAMDLAGLAGATNSDTMKAIEAAQEWGRLSLSRNQTAAAVGASLTLANVGKMTPERSSEFLTALMTDYNLRPEEMNGVVGELNYMASTKRVLPRELLEGMSRVQNFANQAGMGLPELAGLVSAGVAQSGNTGNQIGNALKRVGQSLVNPANRQYLRAMGIEPTSGGGEGLKSLSQIMGEVYGRYQGMNREERINLSSRLAGGNQASRFAAILEGYPEAQRLAAESQLHMDAAQGPNKKILNTMHGRYAEMKAEADKLTMDSGNQLSPYVRGLTRAGTAWARGARLAPFLAGISPGPGIFYGLTAPLNQDEKEERAAGLALDKSQIAEGKMGAAQTWASSAKSAQTALAGALPGNVADLGKQWAWLFPEGRARDKFVALTAAGNTSEARAMLGSVVSLSEGRGRVALQEKMAVTAGRITAGEVILKRQVAAGEDTSETQIKLSALRGEVRKFARDDEMWGTTDGEARRQTVANEATMTTAGAGGIAQLYGGLPALGHAATLGNQIAGGRASERWLLERQKAANKLPDSVDKDELIESIAEQLKGTRATLAYSESATGRGLARMGDDQDVARHIYGVEANAGAVGLSQGAQLLNKESDLGSKIFEGRRKGEDGLGDNERTRLLEFETQQLQTQQAIVARTIESRREEKQLMLESQREFNRGLLLAGPGELLKRLAVRQLAAQPGGMTAGRFMSMAPDMRKMYMDLRGGVAGGRLREEQRELNKRGLTLEELQANRARSAARTEGLRNGYANGTGFGGSTIEGAVKIAAAGLNLVASAARDAAAALRSIATALGAGVGGGRTPVAPSAKGLLFGAATTTDSLSFFGATGPATTTDSF
jgi:TP901 family phage tail tape measure protein